CLQALGPHLRSGDPKRAHRNRCADYFDPERPRPNAAPNRIRRGTCDIETVPKGCGGTPMEIPAVPTALVRWHRHGRFPERRGLSRLAAPRPSRNEIRVPVAGDRGSPASTTTGPTLFEIVWLLPPSLNGRPTYAPLCPNS